MKLLVLFLVAVLARGAVTVSTAQYGNTRTSANTSETTLTPANVATISRLGSFVTDGKVYAQPLVISDVSVGAANKVLVTVTMHGTVYAYNADLPGSAALWTRSVGTAWTQANYPSITDFYHDEISCIATPVVDTAANVIYTSCVTIESGWQLFSFNLADGTDFHAPVTLAGTNNGVTFVSSNHICRPATALFNGNVIVSCSGIGDQGNYQGWMFSYNATTLTQVAKWAVTSTTTGWGGLWLSGGGPAFDGTDIYISTGNAPDGSAINGASDFANSLVRLSQLLIPIDYVTPANYATLNTTDKDINSGKIFLSGSYVIGGGKDGRVFVADKSGAGTMGQLEGVGAGPHQMANLANGAIFGCTVFANNVIYLNGLNTTMKSFAWDSGTGLFNETPIAFGPSLISPGPACTYTSNGATTTTGLLWGVTTAASSFSTVRAGTLRAWNGLTLSEVYNSDTSGVDALGNQSKFGMITIANGRIFVPTFSNEIVLYGFPTTYSSVTGGVGTIGGTGTLK